MVLCLLFLVRGVFYFMKKISLVFGLLVLCLLSSCKPNTTSDSFVLNIQAPAFSGYICGVKGSETFLQLPIFVPDESNFSLNGVNQISLTGDKISFSCSNYLLSPFTESEYEGYKFATLSFRVLLEESGEFVVDKLKISSSENSAIELNLGKITLDILDHQVPQTDYLSMSQFFISQAKPSSFRISYTNNTDKDIRIETFTYPSDVCSEIKIEKYDDFELSTKETDFIIPPREEKTFLITFEFDDKFIENEGKFFYFLPFVVYEIDDTQFTMPGQIQATVVQTPFTEAVVSEIVNKKSE